MGECNCGDTRQDSQGTWVCTPDASGSGQCHWELVGNNPGGVASFSGAAQPMVPSKKANTRKVGRGDRVVIPDRHVAVVGEELGDDHVRVHFSEITHRSKVFHRDELHLIEKPKPKGKSRKQAKKQE